MSDKSEKKEKTKRNDNISKNITKKVLKTKIPEALSDIDSEYKILMPFVVTLMHSDMSKIQMNIIMNLIDKIRDKLKAVINHEVKPGDELSLFADNEINEEGTVNLHMFLKEFDVQRGNYPKLCNGLKMIASVPVELPYKSPSGRMYKSYQNFCKVFIPEDIVRNKYCIVSFSKEVAEAIMKLDLNYHYVGKHTSYSTKTKYSERIYWLISGYQTLGGVTISLSEFRKILGIEHKYPNFANVVDKILRPSQEELSHMAEMGHSDCYFEYEPIYNEKKSYGKSQPSALKFTIFKGKAQLNKQLESSFAQSVNLFIQDLVEKLGLTPKIAMSLSDHLTPENISEAQNKLLYLDTLYEEDKQVKSITNKPRHALKSMINFFENFGKGSKESESESIEKPKQPAIWLECLEIFRSRLSDEDFEQSFGQVVSAQYRPAERVLTLFLPDINISKTLEDKHLDLMKEVFLSKIGEGFHLFYKLFDTQEQL